MITDLLAGKGAIPIPFPAQILYFQHLFPSSTLHPARTDRINFNPNGDVGCFARRVIHRLISGSRFCLNYIHFNATLCSCLIYYVTLDFILKFIYLKCAVFALFKCKHRHRTQSNLKTVAIQS